MKISRISDCKKLRLKRIDATHGHISVVQAKEIVPFDVNRVFYLYDIEAGESRGAHAHKECHQFLIAVTGAFEVELFDGEHSDRIMLNQPFEGLHIPPGIWASEVNFSGASVCLVLASHVYDEADYLRDIKSFEEYKSI